MYYSCSGGTSNYSQIDPGGPLKCNSPVTSRHYTIKNTHLSNEFRVTTPDDWRLRGIAGADHEQFRVYDDMNFNYKTIPACTARPCWRSRRWWAAIWSRSALPTSRPIRTSTAHDPNIRGDNTAFGEDTQRGYDQTAFFASLDFDIIPNMLTVSAGTRWFQYQEYELGSVYTTGDRCENNLGPCLASSPKHNIDLHHDDAHLSGFKSRLGVTWNIDDDTMADYPFSQGFRPGGFNRYNTNEVLKDASGNPQYTTPNSFKPDRPTNNEVGVKTELFDGILQLNLSAYYMRWNNVQSLFFEPLYTGNVTFATNGPSYDVKGAELQFVGRPVDDFTGQGAVTYNENTEAAAPCLIGNIAGNPSFGKCITMAGSNPTRTRTAWSAVSPPSRRNGRAISAAAMTGRWAIIRLSLRSVRATLAPCGNQPANYVSGAGLRSPRRRTCATISPSYITFDASLGIRKDQWTVEIFGENLATRMPAPSPRRRSGSNPKSRCGR